VAFDMETHVINQRFLAEERILAISFARRTEGVFLESYGIKNRDLTS